jgi:hypothetical protein
MILTHKIEVRREKPFPLPHYLFFAQKGLNAN